MHQLSGRVVFSISICFHRRMTIYVSVKQHSCEHQLNYPYENFVGLSCTVEQRSLEQQGNVSFSWNLVVCRWMAVSLLCEVHLWSEHLVVMAERPFCGSNKNFVLDPPPPTEGFQRPFRPNTVYTYDRNAPFNLVRWGNKRQGGWTSHRSCLSTASGWYRSWHCSLSGCAAMYGLWCG